MSDSQPPDETRSGSESAHRVASPEATGGAGFNFETGVAAIALARLLNGDRVPGLEVPVTRVRLQAQYAGHPLDDVVAEGLDALGQTRVVEFQAKRSVSPAPSDGDFVETIERCCHELQSELPGGPISSGRRRFGLVSRPSGPLDDLASITRGARSQSGVESFLALLRGSASKGVLQRLTQLRAVVSSYLTPKHDSLAPEPSDLDVDELTWRVARSLHVWLVEAEVDGAGVLGARDRLTDLTADAIRADELFDALVTSARDWAPQAATVDLPMLRQQLETIGFALSAAPSQRVAFEALALATSESLDTSVVSLGGRLVLPRLSARAEVTRVLFDGPATLLSGPAGVGKSMLARLIAADVAAEGAIVVGLNLTSRSGGLPALQDELGLQLHDAFAGAPIGDPRVLIIDGAEQVLSDAGSLLKAVLGALPASAEGASPWSVLLVARDEAASAVESMVAAGKRQVQRVPIGELSDDEVAEVLAEFPALESLGRNDRARGLLLRRPYLVELLIRSSEVAALGAGVIGEEDLVDVVTARLVRRDEGALGGKGAPDSRSDIYLALAEAAIADSLPSSLDGRDAAAREGLRSDGVIQKVRLSWRFGHDVLVDYAVATRMLEPGGAEALAAASNPRRLIRGVRLRMQRQLADAVVAGDLIECWNAVTREASSLAARDGQRWNDVPFEALLHVGLAREIFDALREQLLANDGAELLRVVDVAERLARRNIEPAAGAPLSLDVSLTGPVVDALARVGNDVPAACRLRSARLVHHHLAAGFAYSGNSTAGLTRAELLPSALIAWVGNDTYGDVLKLSVGALAMLGSHLESPNEEFLVEHAVARPHDMSEVVESPVAASSLCGSRPDLMLRLAGLFYVGRGLDLEGFSSDRGRRPRPLSDRAFRPPFAGVAGIEIDDELGEEGVRDHDSRQSAHLSMWPLGNNQAHPLLGPFLSLLRSDQAAGLRLIGAVVDAATEARIRLESGYDAEENVRVDLKLVDQHSTLDRAYRGTSAVWCWHRRTSVGPGPAQSALMALRQWASELVSAQAATLRAMRDCVLNCGASLGFPAVAWFLCLEFLDEVTDEMDCFMVHADVWSLEINRRTHESSGIALAVPEVTRLDWVVSQVAMQLVLRGDVHRRTQLSGVGDQLLANAEAQYGAVDPVVSRWASELDIANYRAEDHEEGVAISVDYDPDVLAELSAGAASAQRGLSGASLMMRSISIRDSAENADDTAVETIWSSVVDYVEDGSRNDLYPPGDMLAAAAAAVIAATRRGAAVSDVVLESAAKKLVDAASATATSAPPALDDLPPIEEVTDANEVREYVPQQKVLRSTVWDSGFDRSAASGLAWLMSDVALSKRAKLPSEVLNDAIVSVATSPYFEARSRLVKGLLPLTGVIHCESPGTHDALLAVSHKFVQTAGYGPLRPWGGGYPDATLPEPISVLLDSAETLVLDIAAAAYAIPLLSALEDSACEHTAEALVLLDSLLSYDQRLWTTEYARRHYSETHRWRREIDQALAKRFLHGDDDALDDRLEAWRGYDEQQLGVLKALPEIATTAEELRQLHSIWPRFYDRLLPAVRQLDGDGERVYWRDVHDLDEALLLSPPDRATNWPWTETLAVAVRWFSTYAAHAAMADRAIKFVARLLGLDSPVAVELALRVIGEDHQTIKRESRLTVPFIQIVLRHPLEASTAGKVRALLDGLAALGDEAALSVQYEQENG